MSNLLQACRTLITEAYRGRFFVKIAPEGFERFEAAVDDTAHQIDPDKVAIIMPATAWAVLEETLAMDAESSHIDRALREEIQAALDTIETVQLLHEPADAREQAAAFDPIAAATCLPSGGS
jgi:hypothetical protein